MNNYGGHEKIGEKFDKKLQTKDIAKLIKKEMKKKYPEMKISIRTTHNNLRIDIKDDKKDNLRTDKGQQCYKPQATNGVREDNDKFTKAGIKKINYLVDLIRAYRRDDSNSQIDYFDTNFYYNMTVSAK